MTIQRSIKKALQNPAGVTGLDLRQVKPTTLFPEIEQFVNLEFIDLSNCTALDWKDACKKLAKLSKLTEIKAFGSDIKELPAEFGLLTYLKKIDFSNNANLTTLPESFSALINLQEINLYSCGIATLPQTVWNFPNLVSLTLSHNKLTVIPESFFSGISNLQSLIIADNQLTAIPASIDKLTSLQTLYVGNNPLTELPSGITELTILETLWLDGCVGLNLEKELLKVKDITIRNLSILGNNLSELPSAFKSFNSIQILNINSNKFNDTWRLVNDLAHLPLTNLDIRFMGTENISLERAQTIIPSLKEIACDTRSIEQFTSDISSWLTGQLSK